MYICYNYLALHVCFVFTAIILLSDFVSSTGDRIILHFYITFYDFLPEWYNALFSFCCPVLFDALPFIFDYGLQQTLQSSFYEVS